MKRRVDKPTGTFSALWVSHTAPADSVRLSVVFAAIDDPPAELDRQFARLHFEGKLRDIAPIDAGPLGGVARCAYDDGLLRGGISTSTICLWVDNISVGALRMSSLKDTDRRAEFVAIRTQVQKTSGIAPTDEARPREPRGPCARSWGARPSICGGLAS